MMMTPFPPKTPAMMRREAAQRGGTRLKPLGPVDPYSRPLQASETGAELDAAIDWLAHLADGRIEVK